MRKASETCPNGGGSSTVPDLKLADVRRILESELKLGVVQVMGIGDPTEALEQ